MTSTPTNESPAPQAKGGEPAPWSEDEEDAERLLACASRRKKYGDENCECDEDGSCVECEYDMQDVLKKRYAPLKHTAVPAPQPPVEGLRAIENRLRNYRIWNHTLKRYESVPLAIEAADLLAVLASPSLTAGDFEPVGTQYLHYSPFTGHEVWLDRDFYNGHRATVSREVFARDPAPATLIEQSDSEKP